MLTSTASPPERATYRPFDVSVSRVERLTPHFIRVTFAGADLAGFGAEGLDQRIKLVLPLPGGGTIAFRSAIGDATNSADWYATWRSLPDPVRNPIRTYTARAVRPSEAEVDVDFVAHGDLGPASAWASAARPGDEVMIVGPDAAAGATAAGIAWQPGSASTVLIAGDETAAPAICSIVESLDPDAQGQAFIEMPDPADALPVTAPTGLSVTWLPRGEAAPGSRLGAAVRAWIAEHLAGAGPGSAAGSATGTMCGTAAISGDIGDVDVNAELLWDVPDSRANDRLYAWIAGESACVVGLRRYLVTEAGLDRSQVAFMGYWRRGKSESN